MSEEDDSWGEITPGKQPQEKEKVEYEVENDAQELVEEEKVTAELPSDADEEQQKEPEQQEEPKKAEDPKELQGIETEGAQKRIRRLVAQRKEREQENEELRQRIKEFEEKFKAKEQEEAENKRKTITDSETVLTEQVQLAEKAYVQAVESGEASQLLDAQKRLNSAQFKLQELQNTKATLPPVPEPQTQQQPQQYQQPQQPPVPERPYAPDPNQYDPKAVAWASDKDWFGTDQIKTAYALGVNQQLLDEGFDPEDEDFYQEIDNRLVSNYPQLFSKPTQAAAAPAQQEVEQPEVKATSSQPSQVVGGGSRTISNPKTGRNKKVLLTKEDIALAQQWNIDLDRYAEQKLATEAAEGEYATVNIKRGG